MNRKTIYARLVPAHSTSASWHKTKLLRHALSALSIATLMTCGPKENNATMHQTDEIIEYRQDGAPFEGFIAYPKGK
ncbi:MAG TPA: hypothetical protein PLY93_10680, partial [Turneriella sp.]|nr:hypothetical protein [Turneriella sp.]